MPSAIIFLRKLKVKIKTKARRIFRKRPFKYIVRRHEIGVLPPPPPPAAEQRLPLSAHPLPSATPASSALPTPPASPVTLHNGRPRLTMQTLLDFEPRLRRMSIVVGDVFTADDIRDISNKDPGEAVLALKAEIPLNANAASVIQLLDGYAAKGTYLQSVRITINDHIDLSHEDVRANLDAILAVWPTLTAKTQICWTFFAGATFIRDLALKQVYFDQIDDQLEELEKARCARLGIPDWLCNEDGLLRCWFPREDQRPPPYTES